jgi:hypothetical protein
MKRELLVMSGGMLAFGLVLRVFWGNLENVPRMHAAQTLDPDPDSKFVTQRSPYMRTEH